MLEQLQPKKVFSFFEDLTKIPHGSGSEKAISDYLADFARKRNLEVIQDESLNVIIKKPASKGYEKAAPVIIQGHMDMVCEKTKDSSHDFTKDPLKLRIDGDYISATDTTLGGDDGIAVALGLAVLDSDDIEHGPFELVVTTSEETGMFGAAALKAENIDGKVLLNIDSEEEGIFLVSCAGGVSTIAHMKAEWENPSGKALKIEIKGLKGGHSGSEIDKERANANKLMGRLLYNLSKEVKFNIASVNGGTKHNAIARECECILTASDGDLDKAESLCHKYMEIFKNEFRVQDPGVSITAERASCEKQLTDKDTMDIVRFLAEVPNGVQTMSKSIEGLVESSLNFGVLETLHDEIRCTLAVRSSVESLRDEIADRVEIAAVSNGGTVTNENQYPAWEYREDSPIRDLCVETYKELFNKEPIVTAIHAGLECGLLGEKMDDVDMISFGPDMSGVHTPEEKLSISSVQRTWVFLKELLKRIK